MASILRAQLLKCEDLVFYTTFIKCQQIVKNAYQMFP